MANRLMRWFEYSHLPEKMQQISKPICELALNLDAILEEGPEKTAGLRKLLEAKDCLVRAQIEGAQK